MAAATSTLKANTQEYSSWSPSYAELPMEILLQILRLLDHTDLQMAGSTCSRWREALMSSDLSSKSVVHFTKACLCDTTPPGKDFLKCERPLRNFYFEEVSFGTLGEALSHVGKFAKKVTFDNIDILDKKFYTIFRHLSNLNVLAITRCSALFMTGSFVETADDRIHADLIFSEIHHLSLRHNQYLSDSILLRFTKCMKRLDTLDLSGCHIAYHPAIQKRFYPSDCNIPSEAILTFKYVLHIISLHRNSLRELNLSQTLINTTSVYSLTELHNGGLKLRRLRLANCRQLNVLSVIALLKTQPQLVLLDLSETTCVNDECIRIIVNHTPLLKVLHLAGCAGVSNEGAMLLGTLRYLEHLDISHCDNISSEGILHGIASTHNEKMRELHMACLQVCEECIMAIARNFPELRILDLGHCVNGVTDDSVQLIIQNMRWLRELSLEDCFRITDAAITGSSVSSLDLRESSPGSLNNFHPQPVFSIAERDLNESLQSMKISLRSKAEEEIVRDANRKKAMFAAYEMNLIDECNIDGFNIQRLRGLQVLNLRGCTKISDVSLKYGIKLLELRSLSLSNCQQISYVGMEALVTNCPSIEELDLSDCYNINDRTIQTVTSKLYRLRALHISGCTQLTDHSLDAILVNCKFLKTLSVYRCRRMYTDIEDRLAVLPTLRNVNMDNSTPIDNAEIFRLKKRLDY